VAVEVVGSKSGKTSSPVVITDCGQFQPDGSSASSSSAAKKAKPSPTLVPPAGSTATEKDAGIYDDEAAQ
jgi:hypothetical protein